MKAIALTLLLVIPTAAEAARWKVGSGPAGAQTRVAYGGGMCYYDTQDSGTNQCRYKQTTINGVSGCYWFRESGTNQCTPSPSQPPPPGAWDPVTFTASNGSITIDPYDDGDGVASTMAGHVTARLAYTGEVVRFDVRIRNEIGSSTTTLLGTQVTGLDATTRLSLDGQDHTLQPIYRTTTTWQEVPPPVVPPGGATCAVYWQSFMNQQMMCFGAQAGQLWRNGWVGAVLGTTAGAFGCAQSLFALNMGTYAVCVGLNTVGGFATGMVAQLFFGIGYNQPSACNSDGVARAMMSQACGTMFP
jgi:hypothetical protein